MSTPPAIFPRGLITQGHRLVRYSDDFVVLAKTRPQAEAALEATEEVLARLHLALDAEDTAITDFDQGFKFLGLIFLKDSIFMPFDRPRRERRFLSMSIRSYLETIACLDIVIRRKYAQDYQLQNTRELGHRLFVKLQAFKKALKL